MLNSLMLTIILDEEVFVNYVKEETWELCAAPECPAPKVNIDILQSKRKNSLQQSGL